MLLFAQHQAAGAWPKLLRRMVKRLMPQRGAKPDPIPEPFLVKAVQGRAKSRGAQLHHRFGDDSWFASSTPRAEVLGVADGVGAWKAQGIDAGRFAKELMFLCANLAEEPQFDGRNPRALLIDSYGEMCEQEQPILGSSTACLVALNRHDCALYTANLGDSGFLVLRNGKVLHRSEEMLHAFNTPYQLTVPPEDQQASVHCDQPELATSTRLPLEPGDVLLLATDGLFDNVPESMLVKLLAKYEGVLRSEQLQKGANALVAMAHDLSLSSRYQSPFALKAKASQLEYEGGGKPDDITVILASVGA